MQLTNWREVGAFSLTQVIRIAMQSAGGFFLLAPIYGRLPQAPAAVWIWVISIGFGAVMWFAALPLFLACRAGFGGVPALVAPAGREGSFTSSGAEIGAYLLSYVIELVIGTAFSMLVLGKLYASLYANNLQILIVPVSLVYSVVIAALFFLIFIGLRRGFTRPMPARPTNLTAGD